MPTLSEILDALFTIAPPQLASPEDNVGLQVGDPAQEVTRAVVALDVSRGAIRHAKRRGAQLLLTHHPLLFHPLRSVALDSYIGRLVADALGAGVAIVAMHTNLDYAPGGVNDRLAQTLGLTQVRPLLPWGKGSLVKLAVFVPQADQEKVRAALCSAGAGQIGNYRDCSFRAPGTGTFRPLPGAHPSLGRIGDLEQVPEDRLEVLVERQRLAEVLQALRATHPYEEIAYDIYPLDNFLPGAGRGRIGSLRRKTSLQSFAAKAKRLLSADQVRIVGEGKRAIQTVAVCSGSAREMVAVAKRARADLLVAGEIPHHERIEAADIGLALIELGHGPSERPAVWLLADSLKKLFGANLEVITYDPENAGAR